MNISAQLRKHLPSQAIHTLKRHFPKLYLSYIRNYVFNILGLKKYYQKQDDSLHFGTSILPMKMIYKSFGFFYAGFADIIYPMLPDTDGVEKIPFDEGPYEFSEVRLNRGEIVFDFGSNIGLFSLMAAGYKDCTCYAFEPLPVAIAYLNELVQTNPHITPVPFAVSDKNGTVEFSCENDSMIRVGTIVPQRMQKNTITVECVTLDSFVELNKLNRVDFIKADIEGAERLLLKGARNVLKEFAPKLSLCTYHLPDDPQVMRDLILDANPKYVIEEKYKKMYAYVPKIKDC